MPRCSSRYANSGELYGSRPSSREPDVPSSVIRADYAEGMTDAGLGLRGGATPLAVRMRPRSIEEVAGQRHLLTPGSPARRPGERQDGGARQRLDHPLGSARHRQDDAGPGDRAQLRPPLRRALRRLRRRARRAPGHGRGDVDPRPVRHLHGAVPRRDPPLHQGPAGCAAARRRERLGHPRGRHDREPVVLRHLAAAVPLAPAHARDAQRRRPRHPRRPGRVRSARARRQVHARRRGALRHHPAGVRRRQARTDGARGGIGLGRIDAGRPCGDPVRRRRRRRSRSSRPSSSRSPSTARCCATTATATSTTTSSARSSSRCAAPTSTPPCTTSPA